MVRILAKVSAEVTVPYPDRPFDGVFTITTELSPMASPAFEVNRPTETEILLSRLIEMKARTYRYHQWARRPPPSC